ncbi:MAG: cytochrome P450 [Pseudomonadota bacterium]
MDRTVAPRALSRDVSCMPTPRVSQSPTEPSFVQNPYGAYRAFRRHRAVWWEEFGMWVFPRFADVNAIFRDRRFGREILHVATRDELGWDPIPAHLAPFYAFEAHSLLEKEPPDHTRLRSLINRAFVASNVEALRPRITAQARALASQLRDGDDLIEAFCTPIPVTVICELLGAPVEMGPQLLDWSHRMVAMYQARRDRQIEDDAVAATVAFSAYMRELIDERRRAPGQDILSALIAAEADGQRLSLDEVVVTAILLLNAGHEATVHALGNAIWTLAQHRVTVDPETVAGLVEELLRYEPPLHMFTRYVLEDLEWEGIALRKGEQIGLLIGSANRDERVHQEPDSFQPTRPNPRHVSLSAGLHFCIGAPLARLEMQVALTELFDVLGPDVPLLAGGFKNTYHFRGLSELRLGHTPGAKGVS